MALIRRYSVQMDGISGWYDVTGPLSRTEALAELKRARAASKRAMRGGTYRLHELPSVRRKTANPCACKVANPAKRGTGMDAFTRAYIEAALWSSTDDFGTPLDRDYGVSDLAGPTLLKMKRDAAKFQREHSHDLAANSSARGGSDFWLTRNRHGSGYWDGDWPKPEATRLTDAAHGFGEVDLYVGDNGKIHQSDAYKRAVGRKSKAGRKTATRRKVSARKVANPSKRRAPKRKAASKPRRRAKR